MAEELLTSEIFPDLERDPIKTLPNDEF